ncbi:MAG: Ig-like domain-containing domain [Planctomycetota bacterium]|jgi:hypothetical protein
MAWISKFSGLPTLTIIPVSGDTYGAGVFTIGSGFPTNDRNWHGGINAGSAQEGPIAYETLAGMSASISQVLRVTARYASRSVTTGSDMGAGVALFGPGTDDNVAIYNEEFDPGGAPGNGFINGATWENDVLTGTGADPTTTETPPHQYRLYWNGTGSAFIIPDAGFGSWSIAANTVSYWSSKDDGTTWVRLGDRAIAGGVAPTRVGIFLSNNAILGGPGDTVTFSNLEVMEDGVADTKAPEIHAHHPKPNTSGHPTETTIAFDVDDASDVDEATVVIRINPGTGLETAWTGDTAQAGYTVSRTFKTNGLHYEVTRDAGLDAAATITVEVDCDDTLGNPLSDSWTFATGPTIRVPTPYSMVFGASSSVVWTAAGTPITQGYRFGVHHPCIIKGVRHYSALAGAHTLRGRLWDGIGTQLRFGDLAVPGPGFYEIPFTAPYVVTDTEIASIWDFCASVVVTDASGRSVAGSATTMFSQAVGNAFALPPTIGPIQMRHNQGFNIINDAFPTTASNGMPVDPMIDWGIIARIGGFDSLTPFSRMHGLGDATLTEVAADKTVGTSFLLLAPAQIYGVRFVAVDPGENEYSVGLWDDSGLLEVKTVTLQGDGAHEVLFDSSVIPTAAQLRFNTYVVGVYKTDGSGHPQATRKDNLVAAGNANVYTMGAWYCGDMTTSPYATGNTGPFYSGAGDTKPVTEEVGFGFPVDPLIVAIP